MALPPYFTTTVAPAKAWMYGSASTRIAARVSASMPERSAGFWSSVTTSRRSHVLVDVGVGEVVGEDVRVPVAEAEVGGDLEVAPGHVLGHRLGVVGRRSTPPRPPSRRRRRRDSRSGSKSMPALPRSLADPAPVRVARRTTSTCISWLSATARAPRSASSSDGRALTSTRTTLVAPSASPAICIGQRPAARPRPRAARSSGVGRRAGLAAGQDDDGVVGGRAAVDDQPVEASRRTAACRTPLQRRAGRPRRRW